MWLPRGRRKCGRPQEAPAWQRSGSGSNWRQADAAVGVVDEHKVVVLCGGLKAREHIITDDHLHLLGKPGIIGATRVIMGHSALLDGELQARGWAVCDEHRYLLVDPNIAQPMDICIWT